MIKFINWFIRPLGYVCVKKEETLEAIEKQIMIDIWDEVPKEWFRINPINIEMERFKGAESFYASYGCFAEKPEYKDNVVPFNKLV
jgi:predicted GNAT family N-acyltransferase